LPKSSWQQTRLRRRRFLLLLLFGSRHGQQANTPKKEWTSVPATSEDDLDDDDDFGDEGDFFDDKRASYKLTLESMSLKAQ